MQNIIILSLKKAKWVKIYHDDFYTKKLADLHNKKKHKQKKGVKPIAMKNCISI